MFDTLVRLGNDLDGCGHIKYAEAIDDIIFKVAKDFMAPFDAGEDLKDVAHSTGQRSCEDGGTSLGLEDIKKNLKVLMGLDKDTEVESFTTTQNAASGSHTMHDTGDLSGETTYGHTHGTPKETVSKTVDLDLAARVVSIQAAMMSNEIGNNDKFLTSYINSLKGLDDHGYDDAAKAGIISSCDKLATIMFNRANSDSELPEKRMLCYYPSGNCPGGHAAGCKSDAVGQTYVLMSMFGDLVGPSGLYKTPEEQDPKVMDRRRGRRE
jgi:hypothetical protein